MTKKEMSFEEAVTELEQILEKLEDNELTLEESVELYQKGMELSVLCKKKLDEAEQKITILSKEKE